MSSLYSKYCKEVMNLSIIEDENSFITFHFIKAGNIHCVKIQDLYVSEEFRGHKKWLDLMSKIEEIAKQKECNLISAQISKTSPIHVQNRTKHLCDLYNMKQTYENETVFIYSRSL